MPSSSSDAASATNRLETITQLDNAYFALRHGQSQANVAQLIAASPDVACENYGLSDLGWEQATGAGQVVVDTFLLQKKQTKDSSSSSWQGVVLLASDLLRAQETAQAVATAVQAADIPLYQDQVLSEVRLRERGFGDWDLTSDSNYPKVWQDDQVDSSHTHHGVESVDSVMDRATTCVLDWDHDLRQQEQGQIPRGGFMVICVAHGDVLQILQTAFSKLPGSQHRSLEHLETASLRKLELA